MIIFCDWYKGSFMFKLKIISYTTLLTSLFTILSGCSGGGNKKDSGEINSSNPIVEAQ